MVREESRDKCVSLKAVLEIYDEWFATCNIADKRESPKAKINALPPVTPQPNWTPISEGLPKKDRYAEFYKCLIAVDCTTRHNICDTQTAYFDGKHFYTNRYDRSFVEGVKAWMPLPESYIEREKEKSLTMPEKEDVEIEEER